MSPAITEAFVLASDVRLTLVQELPRSLREKLGDEVGGYALSRSRSRAPVRLLDDDSAGLLQRFRSPTRIIDAVLAYSRDRQTEPRATLDEAFPMLRGLIESEVLIAVDSMEAVEADASLQVGERFAGVRVIATVQSLDDTEVHLVRDDSGDHAALKLFKTARRPAMLTFMRREAAILRRLPSGPFPHLLRAQETPECGYLLLEWRSGISAEAAAAEARQMVPQDGGRALLELLRAIARAYALLHAARVVHGDVHPGNVLVAADGSVTLVDFGFAVADGPDEITTQAPRAGSPFTSSPSRQWHTDRGRPCRARASWVSSTPWRRACIDLRRAVITSTSRSSPRRRCARSPRIHHCRSPRMGYRRGRSWRRSSRSASPSAPSADSQTSRRSRDVSMR